jgi:hypothetical protein
VPQGILDPFWDYILNDNQDEDDEQQESNCRVLRTDYKNQPVEPPATLSMDFLWSTMADDDDTRTSRSRAPPPSFARTTCTVSPSPWPIAQYTSRRKQSNLRANERAKAPSLAPRLSIVKDDCIPKQSNLPAKEQERQAKATWQTTLSRVNCARTNKKDQLESPATSARAEKVQRFRATAVSPIVCVNRSSLEPLKLKKSEANRKVAPSIRILSIVPTICEDTSLVRNVLRKRQQPRQVLLPY